MADDTSNGRRPEIRTNDQHQDSSLTSVTSVTRSFMAEGETAWTPTRVEDWLRKAIAVRAAVVEGPVENEYASGRSPESSGIIGVIGSAKGNDGIIDMATEALSWLHWLEPDDAGIVAARLEGVAWKSICWRFGISRPTADRRYRYALGVVAWRLNGHATLTAPSLRAMLKLNAA